MTTDAYKEKLNPEQYRVMRERDTERPYSGKYWDNDEGGLYACAHCGTVLFSSLAKIDAENGWPTFSEPVDTDDITLVQGVREEVTCKRCGCHIGYRMLTELAEKPLYVTNSAALNFNAFPELPEEEDDEEKKKEQEHRTLKKQLQNVLVLVAALLSGAGIGYASGNALCQSGVPVVSASPSSSTAVSPPPATSIRPATPNSSVLPAKTATPTALPTATLTPKLSPVSSDSSDGSAGTP